MTEESLRDLFICETSKLLSQLEPVLLAAKNCGGFTLRETDAVFRVLHTIKGSSAMMGCDGVAQVSHAMENLFSHIRSSGGCARHKSVCALLGAYALYVKSETDRLAAELPPQSPGALIGRISRLLDTLQSGKNKGIIPAAGTCRHGQASMCAAERQNPAYISVKAEKLDRLISLASEFAANKENVSAEAATGDIDRLKRDLQSAINDMRITSVADTFFRMERVARCMCEKTGKRAELVFEGEDTEMDRAVLNKLAEPLMHIICNCVDHGIEPVRERVRHGKPQAGRITLSAETGGGCAVITVSDDGRGLNRELIIKKGQEMGIVNKPASELTESEVFSLIFTPGFSTNEEVTEYSGRGVGMDAVKNTVEEMGGEIAVASKPGTGTSFSIRVPLSLSVIDGLYVAVGEAVYILPKKDVLEWFKPRLGTVFGDPAGCEMAFAGKSVFPVVRLHRLLGLKPRARDFTDGILVLTKSGKKTFCLFVDAIAGERQTVIKPLPEYIADMGAGGRFSGCAIMPDGTLSLIIDVNSICVRPKSVSVSAFNGRNRVAQGGCR